MAESNLAEDNQFESINETDTLSPEEREQVFQEMEAIFAQGADDREDLTSFDMTDVSTGSRFPIIFNISLILIVGVSIVATLLLINRSDTIAIQQFNELTSEETSTAALAQEIISQGQAEVESQQQELEEMQARLESLQSGAGNLDVEFTNRVDARRDELNAELNMELELLRKQLEEGNFSAEEIARRVKEREEQLRQDYDSQLLAYQQEQDSLKVQREAEIQQQIAALENQARAKEDAINAQKVALEAEAQRLKEELEAQAVSQSNQLSEAQSNLQQLQEEKEEKQKALNQFDLYHRNIIRQIERKELDSAKEAILNAKREIATSKFRNDAEFITYVDAYNTYSVMIDGTIAAQKYLEQVTSDSEASLAALQNTSALSSEELAEQAQIIERLREELSTSKNDLAEAKVEVDSLSRQLTGRKQEITRISRQLTAREQEIVELQRLSNTTTADLTRLQNQTIPNEIVDLVLNNIQIIGQYLALSVTGVQDNEARELIVRMIDSNTLYQDVVDILLLAVDPTGSLTF